GLPDNVSYMLKRGYLVYGLDIRDLPPNQHLPYGFCFIKGDVRKTGLPGALVDVVTCVSSLEHVGVAGRYGMMEEDEEGDRKAMAEMRRVLKDEGLLLLTTHFGVRAVYEGLHRIYDEKQIRGLTQGFNVEAEEYYCREEVEPYHYPIKAAICLKPSGASIIPCCSCHRLYCVAPPY
ncbi:unnamed protein product, partial [marine sediment metagenome]